MFFIVDCFFQQKKEIFKSTIFSLTQNRQDILADIYIYIDTLKVIIKPLLFLTEKKADKIYPGKWIPEFPSLG